MTGIWEAVWRACAGAAAAALMLAAPMGPANATGIVGGRTDPRAVASGQGSVQVFVLPSVGSDPSGIITGPDGNLWFTETTGNRIGCITPAGAVTEYPLPSPGSGPTGITAGPDGNLWFTEYAGNRVGRITPAGEIAEYALPTPRSGPSGITTGPDGNLWFTETTGNRIGRISPAGVITEFGPREIGGTNAGITTGKDGNLWFTATAANAIGRITVEGAIAAHPLTQEYVGPFGWQPNSIAAGTDGALWFTEELGNAVGRMTTAGVPTAYPLPSGGGRPQQITQGPDGAMWFTVQESDRVGRVSMDGLVTEFDVFGAGSGPYAITTGPDGALWVTERQSGAIARVPAQVAVAQAPPPQVEDAEANQQPGPHRVAITWSWQPGPVARYEVQASRAARPRHWHLIGTAPPSEQLMDWTGGRPGRLYLIRVRAVNGSGPGQWSRPVTLNLQPVPARVRGVTAQRLTVRSAVEVRWTPVSAPGVSYVVMVAEDDADPRWSVVAVVRGSRHKAVWTDARPRTGYRFRVRAGNAAGDGPYSAQVVVDPVPRG